MFLRTVGPSGGDVGRPAEDTSFGSMPMVRRMLKLLHERVELMKAVV